MASCSTNTSNDGSFSSGGVSLGPGGTSAGTGASNGGQDPRTTGGAEAVDPGGAGGPPEGASGGAPSGTGGAIDTSTGGSFGSGGAGATLSEGCEAGAEAESGLFTIDVEGTDREYILRVPDDYSPSHPYRLIFGWHGRMYDAKWVANGEPPLTGPYFGIEAESGGEAIFVAPQALSTGWSNEGGRDIAFTKAMVARLRGELCIDTSRIFSTGFSFGAMMTIGIGCELADTFRAIAPMSGSLGSGCPESSRPIAYWASHGLSDSAILPQQGEAARNEFIERNHCDNTSQASEREGCVAFEKCDPGYPVTWCAFDGVHEPPPFAGAAIWGFLSEF